MQKKTISGLPIDRGINAGQLLTELHQKLGVTGVIRRPREGASTLHVQHRPSSATDKKVQDAIAAHKPRPKSASFEAQLAKWDKLSPAEREAVQLAALKQLLHIR